jgi:hypothetical protein
VSAIYSGVINVGGDRMPGYRAAEVVNKITPARPTFPLRRTNRARLLFHHAG